MTDAIAIQHYINGLNDPNADVRLRSLKQLKKAIDDDYLPEPEKVGSVNNHIHTTFSFSPYSPAKAVWMAYNAGLITAGIVDHDSISGAREFIEAGRIVNLATTIGIEIRVDFSKTPLNGRRINHTDQSSIAYIALQAIPHNKIDDVAQFMVPFVKERNIRNRMMIDRINDIVGQYDVKLNYDEDVVPISMLKHGGSITERHILFALSQKLISRFGKGGAIVDFLKHRLGLKFSAKVEACLMDEDNQLYDYDLLGALKSDFIDLIYVDATTECPDVREVTAFSDDIGAISAYQYLGDVTLSVTGDKKTQKFEDDYLDLLFDVITDVGFRAVSYMPSRNTPQQLDRVRELCRKFGFLQISGEDINTPRQSFICEAMKNPEFKNLIDATWALIGHEKSATIDPRFGMFSKQTIAVYPDLDERIRIFRTIGKGLEQR